MKTNKLSIPGINVPQSQENLTPHNVKKNNYFVNTNKNKITNQAL